MQKAVRINDNQIQYLSSKAKVENTISGYLYKRGQDANKWQQRWFSLYQNLLFYFENENTTKPSGVALLEGAYTERLVSPSSVKGEKQYCFAIFYRKEGQRHYDLRAETDAECNAWIDAIKQASFGKIVEQKEQLEQKHLHLLQILDSERQAKWHYVQQTEELAEEVKKLKDELKEHKGASLLEEEEESEDIKKIKKVQSFFRGWLCRRRWKQIVDEYIRSPHAESMRKRNSIVFTMVEDEETYVKQLSTLVSHFLRPLRMAASSKKPPITHEDVNSIFLNSETILFLHQIFLKGLASRMENWPTLVLGDLFDMLLPMLGIYQEYVRNHHYSLQVLAEYKQKLEFSSLLKRYEEKQLCEGRSLEHFLTIPMHQIPRYIITLHELLAHTPHDHVERKSLDFAKSKLEELSRVMHDEVSETENIRKNLAIERMIIEGCDILLDVNQTFVRQGLLLQVLTDKPKTSRGRLGSFSSSFKEGKKEAIRQVFLFTNHLLLTSRASNGRLHLAKHNGKISLIDCTLIEDQNSEMFMMDEESLSSVENINQMVSNQSSSNTNQLNTTTADSKSVDYNSLDFRIIVDSKSGPPTTIVLVASTQQDKAAWCSDVSQCIENLHYTDLLNSSLSDTSSVTMPQSVRSDPKLFRDDYDIKFSRTLNSCKVPQIRHASVEKILDRLTDLRFLSIDFVNTFLLTYRVFTTGKRVLEALTKVYKNPEYGNIDSFSSSSQSCDSDIFQSTDSQVDYTGAVDVNGSVSTAKPVVVRVIKPTAEKPRRISTGSMKIEVTGECSSEEDATTETSAFKKYERAQSDPQDLRYSRADVPVLLYPPKKKLAPIASCETLSDFPVNVVHFADAVTDESSTDTETLQVPDSSSNLSSSTETLVANNSNNSHSINQNLPEDNVCREPSIESLKETEETSPASPKKPLSRQMWVSETRPLGPPASPVNKIGDLIEPDTTPVIANSTQSNVSTTNSNNLTGSETASLAPPPGGQVIHRVSSPLTLPSASPKLRSSSPTFSFTGQDKAHSPSLSPNLKRSSSPSLPTAINGKGKISPKRSTSEQAGGLHPESTAPSRAKCGSVVTSSRTSKRRSSSSAATAAFAAATAGVPSSPSPKPHNNKAIKRNVSAGAGDLKPYCNSGGKRKESVISTAATMRVLNVLRHWVSKHAQDFDQDPELKSEVKVFLGDMLTNATLMSGEHKAALSILHTMAKEESFTQKINLTLLLASPLKPSRDNFDTLSALDIAEQLTYLDHKIFMAIRSEELLSQAWMKPDKSAKSPHVLLVSKRFNEVSRLVVSEVVSRKESQAERIACIEKWAAIADICRCMQNYNGVLQICAAFVNSSVYRLKKTWDKVSKQTKQMIEKLQTLVSSDGRFRNMRDALHRCDPPCIPYLGMYLTDLSFIEEGTPNRTDDELVNFSKMRMVAHVIREIQVFQQTAYKIEQHARVTNYLLDPSRLLDEEATYKSSLEIEPRTPRITDIKAATE